jgi:VanZ family protein
VREALRSLWLVGLVYGLILAGTLVPSGNVPDGPAWMAVAFHVGTYMLLGVALQRALPHRPVLAIAAVAVALGAGNEALQSLTHDRTAQLADLVADTFGAAVGAIASRLLRRGPTGAGPQIH